MLAIVTRIDSPGKQQHILYTSAFPATLETLLKVGRGVTVRADIRVPFGTVAVTRGGELRGSVFAREFLLEDGETHWPSCLYYCWLYFDKCAYLYIRLYMLCKYLYVCAS